MSESNASAISTPRAVSRTHKLTVTAMLSTVAFLLMFIEFPIPALIPAFVKLDISDLPELLAAFSLGPIYGVVVTLLKNVLFSVLHGTSSAYVGELFNFIMGSATAKRKAFITFSCRHSTLTPNSTAQITRMMIDSFLPNWSRLT